VSTIGDVLRAVKDVLLLQSQVEQLDDELRGQEGRIANLTDKVTDLDKRVYAIERIMDLSSRQARQPRLEE
jgi:hypothetical protein